jgi:hypothetical protein
MEVNSKTRIAVIRRRTPLKINTGRFTWISSILGSAAGSQGIINLTPHVAASTPASVPSARIGSSSAAA